MTGLVALAGALAVLLWPGRRVDRPVWAPRGARTAPARAGLWQLEAGELVARVRRASTRALRRACCATLRGWRPSWLPSRLAGALDRLEGAAHASDAECVALAEALVPCLEAGLTPAQACAVVAESVPPRLRATVDRLATAAARGEPATAVLHDVPGLRTLATAWSLSDRLGSPLADAVAQSAASLRRADAVRRGAVAAAAGPRASMLVLSLLPLSGPLVGWALGVDPLDLYARSALTVLCPVLGGSLTALGWWWGDRLVARALSAPTGSS